MYCEIWFKIWCEKCNIPNWFCNGNPDDLTIPDIEGFECFNCRHKWEIMDGEEEIIEDIEYETGREKPE